MLDIEKSFYPHLVNVDSMKVIFDEGVHSEWFFDKQVRAVFDFALTYFIAEKFKLAPDQELLEGKFPYIIADWTELRSLSVLIPDLKLKYQRNVVDSSLKITAVTAQKDPDLAIREQAERLIDLQRATSSRKRFLNFGESFSGRIDDYFEEVASGHYRETHSGYPLFWDEITEYTNGILPGELAFLIGAANAGKSFFLAHQALYAAKNKVKTYYASLENPPEMTVARLDCIFSGIPYQKYERGELNHGQTQKLREAKEEIESFKEYLIVDMPSDPGERTLVELYARAQYEGAEMIVGDQLDWITPASSKAGDQDYSKDMARTVQQLTYLNRQSGMAGIWGGQLNREGSKEKGRKSLFNFAGTSFIERNADWIFGISATEEQRDTETAIFDIMKTRRAAKAPFLVDFSLTNETAIRYIREADID